MKIIDLSHIIDNKLPSFPQDTKTHFKQMAFFAKNGFNSYKLEFSLHSGTHIDTPMHFSNNKNYVSTYSIDNFLGEGVLIDCRNKMTINYDEKYENLDLKNKIVLIYTSFNQYFGQDKYFSNHPILSEELITFFIKSKIKILGLDTPSPDRSPYNSHKMLFENNIFILENLTNLDKLLPYNRFEIMAIPLNVMADSSPVRACAKIRI